MSLVTDSEFAEMAAPTATERLDGPVISACPDCGRPVKILYTHELDRPPICGDCFEYYTVPR